NIPPFDYVSTIVYSLSLTYPMKKEKKEARSFLSLSSYKDFLLLETPYPIDCHITDYKLSHFRLYLLINL
ncbi:hypothetical protein K0G28_25790, partial [Bacteroides faecis]|uniref:hypothetical protein n=1 Tax=Bacteroides faecis TaxID=674529 RepID=UPI001F28AF69